MTVCPRCGYVLEDHGVNVKGWKSDDFGRGKGSAVSLDHHPASDTYSLFIFDEENRDAHPAEFTTRSEAINAFEAAVNERR